MKTTNKGNKMKQETFYLEIKNHAVRISHKCFKLFQEQSKEAILDLKEFIKSEIEKGIKKGFIPYNNFECSINWTANKNFLKFKGKFPI